MWRIIFFDFWPVMLPAVWYFLWLRREKRRAEVAGLLVEWSPRPLYFMLSLTLLILIVCFIRLGVLAKPSPSEYTPPHVESDGRIHPAEVTP